MQGLPLSGRAGGGCGAPPHTPAGDIVPCTPLLGLRPKGDRVSIAILLWPCVFIWGFAPSPARASWREASLFTGNQAPERGSILTYSFFDKPCGDMDRFHIPAFCFPGIRFGLSGPQFGFPASDLGFACPGHFLYTILGREQERGCQKGM